jgi:hypothetical protein
VTVGRRAHQRLSRARRRVALIDPSGTGANTVAHLLAPQEVDLEPNDPWGWALNELRLTRDAIWIERSRPGWAQLLAQLVAAQVLEETPPDAVRRGGGRGPVWEAPIAAGAPPRPLELVAVWRRHPVLGFDLGYRIVADGFLALWFLPRSQGRGALESLHRYLRQVEVRAFQHLRGAAWTLGANGRRSLLLEQVTAVGSTSVLPPDLVAELARHLIAPLELADAAQEAVGTRHRLRLDHAADDVDPASVARALTGFGPVLMIRDDDLDSSRLRVGRERLRPCYWLSSDERALSIELCM